MDRRAKLVVAGILGLMIASQFAVRAVYPLPFPHLDRMIVGEHALQDLAITSAGFRRVAADLAWIQLLQFLGGEAKLTAESVRAASLRVVRLDPRFVQAYVYGAGTLAFSPMLNRPYEAMSLLHEGVENNPTEWRLQAILAAIVYKLEDKPDSMIAELRKLVAHPDCPVVIRAILANIHKDRREYGRAMDIWLGVLGGDFLPREYDRAKREIADIQVAMERGRRR